MMTEKTQIFFFLHRVEFVDFLFSTSDFLIEICWSSKKFGTDRNFLGFAREENGIEIEDC